MVSPALQTEFAATDETQIQHGFAKAVEPQRGGQHCALPSGGLT
jgi:hypothetical protein